jgi:AraC-like DNA-binding protein
MRVGRRRRPVILCSRLVLGSWSKTNKILVKYEQSEGRGTQRRTLDELDQPPANGLQLARFSTEAYRAPERTSAWREVFGRTVLRIDIAPLSEKFRAEARAACWPGFGVIYASTSAAHQANSRALIANDDLSFGRISFMANPSRRWRASQLGRNAELSAGDGVLMSNGDVGSITLPSDCRYATFSIPASALKPLVPDIGAWFAHRVPGASPEMRMLSRYLQLGRDEQILATPELRSAFADHVVDLLALALGATRDAAELATTRGLRAARLHAMKEEVRRNLKSPDLSVHAIAARHNVTVRYVQKLFEESGSTFTRFVAEQRLMAAYKALTECARSNVSISTIAYDCGFTDLSNFNSAFRRRFGCTPTDVRSAARFRGGW